MQTHTEGKPMKAINSLFIQHQSTHALELFLSTYEPEHSKVC